MFVPCEVQSYRSGYTTTTTVPTGEHCPASTARARVTYSVGSPPPTIEMGAFVISTSSDFELDETVPTPWARKGAAYVPIARVKDVWRAKWRLSQQRPRDGLRKE